jgi:hypothetical protein
MAENLNLKINLTGEEKVVKSVGELRRAIKAAELEALSLTMQFGEADPRVLQIRESVGKLKNQMADAADQARAFSQDSAFPAVARSVQGIASAFTAVQGAMALFGVENEAVEKTLVKLNAAMALSTGLGGVVEAIDSFKILNSMIQSSTAFKKADIVVTRLATSAQAGLASAVGVTSVSLNALKTAIASTGIGLLVVGIGYLVTKLMEWADSSESTEEANKKLNNTIERQNELLEQNVDNIDFATKKQIADARKRGASAKELRDIEVNGEKDKIAALKKAADDARLLQVDIVKNENATEEQKQKIRDNAKKAIKAYNDAVRELELSNAEFAADQADDQRKKQQEATDKANQKRKAQKEKDNEEALQAQKEADEIQIEAFKATLSEREREEYEANVKFLQKKAALEKAGIKDFALIENQREIELGEIRKKYEEEDAQATLDRQLGFLELSKAQGLIKEDQYQKSLYDLRLQYANSSKEIQDAEIAYAEYQTERKKELIETERTQKLKTIQDSVDALDIENEKLDEDYEKDIERFNQQIALLDQMREIELANEELTGFEKQQIRDKYAKQKLDVEKNILKTEKELIEARKEAEYDFMNAVASGFGSLSTLFAEHTAAAKASAIAEIAVNTALGFMQGLDIAQKGAKATGPAAPLAFPIFYASQIAAVLGAAQKAKQVLTKAKGGSEGSTPTAPTAGSPMKPQLPQVQETQLNQASINALGNQAIKAYVIESDVTTNQQRIAAIRQRARFS